MLDITTPSHPVPMLPLANLLGYRGPTITCPLSGTKPMGLGPGWLWTGTILPGGGAPSPAQPL